MKINLRVALAFVATCAFTNVTAQQIGTAPLYHSNGKVGVGLNNTTPNNYSTLDVLSPHNVGRYGSQLNLHTTSSINGLFMGSYGSATETVSLISSGSFYWSAGKHRAVNTESTTIHMHQGRIKFFSDAGLTIGTDYTPTTRMSILPNGNVGIGTINPVAALEISAVGDGKQILKLSTERPWAFLQEGSGSLTALVMKDLSGGKQFQIKSYADEMSFFFAPSDGKSYFRGNMGIGTTNPKEKLHVNGTILSSEVKVFTTANNVPDYVFKDDYQLTSLADLEEYIKTNNHLPQVPSAEEIEANGLELAKMNLLLLKKIEELTLHTIQQEKKIQTLKIETKEIQQNNQQEIERLKKDFLEFKKMYLK